MECLNVQLTNEKGLSFIGDWNENRIQPEVWAGSNSVNCRFHSDFIYTHHSSRIHSVPFPWMKWNALSKQRQPEIGFKAELRDRNCVVRGVQVSVALACSCPLGQQPLEGAAQQYTPVNIFLLNAGSSSLDMLSLFSGGGSSNDKGGVGWLHVDVSRNVTQLIESTYAATNLVLQRI